MSSGKLPLHTSGEPAEAHSRREHDPSSPVAHRPSGSGTVTPAQYGQPFQPATAGVVRTERVEPLQRLQGPPGSEPVGQPSLFPSPGTAQEKNPGHPAQSPQLPPLPPNINAPNLSTYIHHIHHYTFNAPCTITQNSDPDAGEGPIIHTEAGTYTYSHSEQRGMLAPAPRQVLHRQTRQPGGSVSNPTGGGAWRSQHAGGSDVQQDEGVEPAQEQGEHPQQPRSFVQMNPAGPTISAGGEEPRPHGLPGFSVGPATHSQGLPPANLATSDAAIGVGGRRSQFPSAGTLPGVGNEPPLKRRNRSMSVPAFAGSSRGTGGHSSSVAPLSQLSSEPTGRAPGPPLTGHLLSPFVSPMQHELRTRSSSHSDDPRGQGNPIFGGSGLGQSALQSSSTNTFAVGPEQDNLNDWEQVVRMYLTGAGTPDGIPLKDYTKGGPQRVDDRKLLEKRKTIGKTYEKLGRERFERAIGYKIEPETGHRKKQRMYHVIHRCRIVNRLRKEGQHLPEDADELEKLISDKILEKAESKNAEAPAQHSPYQSLQPQHQQYHHPQQSSQQHQGQRLQQVPQFTIGGGQFSQGHGAPDSATPQLGSQHLSPLGHPQQHRTYHTQHRSHHAPTQERLSHQGEQELENQQRQPPRYPSQSQPQGPP